MTEERKSFVMFADWGAAIAELETDKEQAEAFRALFRFRETGEIPQDASPQARMFLKSITCSAERANARHDAKKKNGKKGGDASGAKRGKVQQSNDNQPQAKPSENKQEQAKVTLNDNVNDNVNVDVNSLFVDYSARAREDIEKGVKNCFQLYFDFRKSNEFASRVETAHEVVNVVVDAVIKIKESGALTFNKQSYFPSDFKPILGELAKNNCEKFCKLVGAVHDRQDINDRAPYILGTIINMGSKPSQEKPPPGAHIA